MGRLYCLFSLAALGLGAWPAGADPVVTPQGELAARLELLRGRILNGQVPAITPEFVLADIALRPDYPRRFNEYSGDVSGRYIGALACVPLEGVPLKPIVKEALTYQKADGRFGSDTLHFTPAEIAKDHMALLWGDGRLLVGLLEYYATDPDPAVLESSRRLGDFLRTVYTGCANEKVAERVKDMGAAGMICFTQLIEGLVMLSNATGDKSYLDTAESIIPWFQQDRGTQHSHGYLSTLRGILMLHEATGKPEHLKLVEDLYASLVDSPDYHIYGGVMEYFGGKYTRDEGCSEADFLRLSLQLWRVTGNSDYLECAERVLVNQFSAGQFPGGDFGHHDYSARGVVPVAAEGRAWWCCTWHGLRAYRDVLDSMITEQDGEVLINLFASGQWSQGETALSTVWDWNPAIPHLTISVDKAPQKGIRLAFRNPSWCDSPQFNITPNPSAEAAIVDIQVEPLGKPGYARLNTWLRTGDRIEVTFPLTTRIVKRDGTSIAPGELGDDPVEGVLFRGPWMFGVCGGESPLFLGEPWGGNQIFLPKEISGEGTPASPYGPRLNAKYTHEGFPGTYDVLLQPLADRTLYETQPFMVWLNYRAVR